MIISARPVPTRRRFAIVTYVGNGDAVDVRMPKRLGAQTKAFFADERNRAVLAPRRWPDAGVELARRRSQATVADKPGTPG